MALISMSQGTASKKPFMMKIANGSSSVQMIRTTPVIVSSSPVQYISRKIGIISVIAGKACSTRSARSRPARPPKSKRDEVVAGERRDDDDDRHLGQRRGQRVAERGPDRGELRVARAGRAVLELLAEVGVPEEAPVLQMDVRSDEQRQQAER